MEPTSVVIPDIVCNEGNCNKTNLSVACDLFLFFFLCMFTRHDDQRGREGRISFSS